MVTFNPQKKCPIAQRQKKKKRKKKKKSSAGRYIRILPCFQEMMMILEDQIYLEKKNEEKN